MQPPIRKTKFVPEWIDMGPKIPVPKTDWILDKKLDAPYGADPLQKMDIYYPNGIKKEAYPALILVHGGGFCFCDKRDWHVYPGFFSLAHGFALISLNYRLAPKDPYPAAVNDVKDAIAYLRKNASALRLDPDNFFLYGTSAGGNLVSYAGLDGAASRGSEKDYHVNAVADLCGLINIVSWHKQTPWYFRLLPSTRKAMSAYLGGPFKKSLNVARQASADSRISKNPPAFYIQHGDKDPAVSVQQGIDFYNKLKASGHFNDKNLVLDVMKGASHAGGGPEYLEPEHIQPIIEFFKSNMK